jgi:hypothetical protein
MKNIKLIILSIFVTLAAGCGGGGGGGTTPVVDPPPPPPVGGIGRTGVAMGPISTFGSVVVNGVHYETTNTTFTFDDNPSTEDQLEVGDIVLVKGTINDDDVTGTADTVFSDDTVTGPITAGSISLTANQFEVLGQLVQVTPETSFDDEGISPASLEGLADGDIVEVHGFLTPDDVNGVDIVATRIENKSAAGLTDDEVHGTVSNRTDTTFAINDLLVDYSTAQLDNSFPNGLISDGDFVEAKGTSSVINGVLTLTATLVELEDDGINGDDGDHVEVEGFITGFVNSTTDFFVAGVQVRVDAGTVVTDAGVAADVSLLGSNLKVEVEGDLLGGILIADNIDIRRGKAVRAVAIVDSTDTAAADPLAHTLVMLDITFTIDALTRFEDKSDARITPLTIADLAMGNYLEIRGTEFPAGSGQVHPGAPQRTELQGFVESFDDPAANPTTLTILGVTIDTNAAEFRDVNDNVIADAAAFYGLLVAGTTLVKVRGTESGADSIAATRVELELEF